MQGSVFGVRARIARDELQLRHGYKELGVFGVIQTQEFFIARGGLDRFQTRITTDAVRQVHDRVADLEFGQVADHRIDIGRTVLATMVTLGRVGVKFRFREDRERFVREALIQGRHGQRNGGVTGDEFFKGITIRNLESMTIEKLRHRLATAH